MKILANYELKDMGQPIKETSCWLFFEKGKIAKHTISRFHYKSEIDKFRRELNFVYFKKYSLPLNETIN